jgi:hypothetical protein
MAFIGSPQNSSLYNQSYLYNSPNSPFSNFVPNVPYSNFGNGFAIGSGFNSFNAYGGVNNSAMIGMAIASLATGLVTLITAIAQSKNDNSNVCSNEDSKTKNFDRQPVRFDSNDFGDNSFDVSLT